MKLEIKQILISLSQPMFRDTNYRLNYSYITVFFMIQNTIFVETIDQKCRELNLETYLTFTNM